MSKIKNPMTVVQSGGSVGQGIIVKSMDANGFPTELDVYGDLWENQFSFDGDYYHNTIGWRNVTKIALKTNQTVLKNNCFGSMYNLETIDGIENVTTLAPSCLCATKLRSLHLPNVTSLNFWSMFNNMSSLQTLDAPKASGGLGSGGAFGMIFRNCTALTDVTIGGVGYGITKVGESVFSGCTQSNLTITMFSVGARVDNIISSIRNKATNATIIIKASEDTTYGGSDYSAGDTIVTDTPSA